MDDFIHRTVTEMSENGLITVSRTRDSTGKAWISLKVGDKQIDFTGAAYEVQCRQLVELLNKVLDNPCALPRAPES